MKRKAALLSAIYFTGMLACSGGGEEGVIRLALQTEPSTLDPALAVDYSSGIVSSLIHSNLVRFDEEGNIVPDLAESWTVSTDGLQYVFRLRRDSGFSDGSPAGARDVVYSFRRLLDPATASPRWWVLEAIRGAAGFHRGGEFDDGSIRAPDDLMVVLTLEKPVAHFLSLLAMPPAGIVNRQRADSLGRDYGGDPCGSGPWKLAYWSRGDGISLEPNRHGGRTPIARAISLRFIPEPMTMIAEFETGNLDILEIPGAELERWRTAGPVLLQREELRVVYIGLNNREAPFDDRRVRAALNMAVDIEAIIAKVLFAAAKKAFGPVPPALIEGRRGKDIYPYDPGRAKELLAEAGYPGGFEMEIWQRDNPEGGRILESVQAYLARVGIRAEIVTREWSAFKQAVDHGTPDAFYLDWFADYADAENFLMPLFHSSNIGGGGNRCGYSNAAADSLLERAALVTDPGGRLELYVEAQDTIYRDAPWIFLWFPVRYEAVSPGLRGYRMPVIFNGQLFLEVSSDQE